MRGVQISGLKLGVSVTSRPPIRDNSRGEPPLLCPHQVSVGRLFGHTLAVIQRLLL